MIRSIVVGTDGSDTARKAVQEAADIAKSVGAKLHLVSAAERDAQSDRDKGDAPSDVEHLTEPTNRAQGVLNDLKQELGLDDVELHAKSGNAAEAIIEVAEKTGADLIVVGNKGMTGAKRFLLGSVPNAVSHHAPCSVLIVRTT